MRGRGRTSHMFDCNRLRDTPCNTFNLSPLRSLPPSWAAVQTLYEKHASAVPTRYRHQCPSPVADSCAGESLMSNAGWQSSVQTRHPNPPMPVG